MIFSLFMDELADIDARMETAATSDIPRLFENIPLDTFGELLLNVPECFPHIRSYFPRMPSEEVQRNWTGDHGSALLPLSAAFVKTMVSGFDELTRKPVATARVLDFGCGWGRILRLLYKFASSESIYAVDAWDESLKLCHAHGVKGHLALTDWVPRTLPFECQFDLIFAFSVFTHLSEKTARVVLQTLRERIAADGLLIITIRPKEYWYTHDGGSIAAEMMGVHETRGFAFAPHNRAAVDGDITYGDTSISPAYIRREYPQWRLVRVDYNVVDPFQLVIFLRPA